jgi:peptidoglycan/xylan/chitin deacetylase (PgdA/CDA1 family)
MSHMTRISRRALFGGAAWVAAAHVRPAGKIAVLTLDDAVKSHRTFVAPLLKELGFRATFFVTHAWMDDPVNHMSWADIAEIHRMGFEIGNHSWTHAGFHTPRAAARLAGELALVDYELQRVGVPRPTSFAWCGNTFGPEAIEVLSQRGILFARRGEMPEAPYGQLVVGATYDPSRHHPLLVPTAGDAYPKWTLEHFQKVVSSARDGQIVVLQFHGVPDLKHPWVHTPPEMFRQYMGWLKSEGFRVIAMRDLTEFADLAHPPADPLLKVHQPEPKDGRLPLPPEMESTRADLRYWLENMLSLHRYTPRETSVVCGLPPDEIAAKAEELEIPSPPSSAHLRVVPYPGGRHPRTGFLEGSISPLRGTKASVFLPWNAAAYLVVDLPEALFSDLGLTFLAHTHVPTIWDQQNKVISNVEWQRDDAGGLRSEWKLPDGISFGAAIRPAQEHVAMELWLRNGTPRALQKLRGQICILLKGASEFAAQTNQNKVFDKSAAAVKSASADRWVVTLWDAPKSRVWGNPVVPCLHVDPVFPDCPAGETVRLNGRLWFYHGGDIQPELERAGRA